jgi:hypothetical protein
MVTPDVNVIFVDMPVSIPGFVKANSDTTYTIILNARHTQERRLVAYQHEMEHIINGDYDKKCDADIIEFYAHKGV